MSSYTHCGDMYRPERDAKDITRLLRKDITAAQKSGRLPFVKVALHSGYDEIVVHYPPPRDTALETGIAGLADRYRCFYPHQAAARLDDEPASNVYVRIIARNPKRNRGGRG